MTIEPLIDRTALGWRVRVRFEDSWYSRYFYYKGDAKTFAAEVKEAAEAYGEIFHPDMIHMYLEQTPKE